MKNKGVLEQEKIKKEQEEKNRENIEKLKTAVNKICSSEEGELFFRYLGAMCNSFKITVNPQSNEMTFFNEGKKAVFLTVWSLLDNNSKKKLIEKLYTE